MKKIRESIIQIEGKKYLWRVVRWPQWCTADGWRGVLLQIDLFESPKKSLMIEYPFENKTHSSTPQRQRPTIMPKDVERNILRAIEAGWDSESSGKPFHYFVEV